MFKTKIIAEIGINHNGNMQLAKKLIDLAKKAGADLVKFQSYSADELIRSDQSLMSYQKKNLKEKISQYQMLKKCELTDNDHLLLKRYCKKRKIKFLCTAYSIKKADFLIKIKEKIIKIASTDSTNLPLIQNILNQKVKVIISTGVTHLDEIDLLLKKLNFKKKKNQISIMHCTSYYPANVEILNLNTISYLKNKYNIDIGYSDHSESEITGALAVMKGASIIEKHFTLSKKMWGPDHKASLEFEELKRYIDNIRFADKAKGFYKKILSKKELDVRKHMQKSIVYLKNLKKNHIINKNDLDSMRPSNGISPLFTEKFIGKKINKDVFKNQILNPKDF